MEKDNSVKIFNDKEIRIKLDEENGDYYYSIMDVIEVLTDSKNPRNYWKVLKHRLKEENNQTVTICNQLKMPSNDGKMRSTDVTSTRGLISIIDNIKSDKKDDFIDWLNQTRLERLYDSNNTTNTLLYYGNEGAVSIEVIIDQENETMWATQKTIAQLFDVGISAINKHLKNIFESGELEEKSVISKMEKTALKLPRPIEDVDL